MTERTTTRRPLLTAQEIWQRYDAIESSLTAPLSERMLDVAGLGASMRVLDLATGRGEPALRAAHRVGPPGLVIGVDPESALLQMAQAKAAQHGLTNLILRVADAESLTDLEPAHFHVATARWGLMYMAAPVTALRNVRRALLPSGVLVAALWAEPERVPYYTLPRQLLARYRSLPSTNPAAPGTFRYADLARLEQDLQQADFAIAHLEEHELPVFAAATAAEVVEWTRALGLTQLLNELPEATQKAWEQDLMRALEQHRSDGRYQLGGVTRIVCARPV